MAGTSACTISGSELQRQAAQAAQELDALPTLTEEFGEVPYVPVYSDIDELSLGTNSSAGAGPAAGQGQDAQQASASNAMEVDGTVANSGTSPPVLDAHVVLRELGKLRKELDETKAQLASARAGPRQPQQGHAVGSRQQVRVSPKDVRLEKFSGNADEKARFIEPDQFLPLLEWLKATEFAIKTSGLPEAHHVPVLIQHLSGAAKSSFIKKHGGIADELSSWSLRDAKLAIAGLVPDHECLFSKAALDMVFKAESLAEDVESFALFMIHGELGTESKFVFAELQKKVLRASPEIFSTAATQHNLHFAYREEQTFTQAVYKLQNIIHVLQVNGQLSKPKVGKEPWKDVVRNGSGKLAVQDRSKRERSAGAGPSRGQTADKRSKRTPEEAKALQKEFSELAKKHSRCYGCGRHVAPEDRESHKSECSRDKHKFWTNMGKVRSLVQAGKDPNGFLKR